jgi:hypothetical protein
MKQSIKILLSGLAISFIALSSCQKYEVKNTANQVGISKVTFYPNITTSGDRFVAVPQGQAYTDPGAKATVNGADVKYTTSMAITSGTAPGVYVINYVATNSDGFSASDFRIVTVIPSSALADPVVVANDFSGTYLRGATGVTSTWKKIGTGVYAVENPGGATSGVGLYAIVTNFSGTSISMPTQDSPYFGGQVSTESAVYSVGPPATYHWIFHASGYGTGVRTFVKQ